MSNFRVGHYPGTISDNTSGTPIGDTNDLVDPSVGEEYPSYLAGECA